jgi:hypothetical protein
MFKRFFSVAKLSVNCKDAPTFVSDVDNLICILPKIDLTCKTVNRVLVSSQPGQHLFNVCRGSNHLEERCDERLGENLLSPK